MADAQPIIIIKKKGHGGGHHGGAWKVAYADFVTAMMALFIVLWLLSSTSKQTQEQIAGYFNDPKGISTKKGSEGKPTPNLQYPHTHAANMDALKQEILLAIQKVDPQKKLQKQIEVRVTAEGLRIDLMEDKNGTFFQMGSAKPTPVLQEILTILSAEVRQLPNQIFIEGHTDAQPYATLAGYDNWELSSDRANETRREMTTKGVRFGQVSEVRGFADQQLRFPDKPYDPANRRVSIVVQPQAFAKLPPQKESPARQPGQNAGEAGSTAGQDAAAKPGVDSAEKPTVNKGRPESLQIKAHAADRAGIAEPGLLKRFGKLFGK